MPDSKSSPTGMSATHAKDYTSPGDFATPAMETLLRQRIAAEGPLDFAAFMAAALYHPELGYYARNARQVGRGGDFFTSVSVGPLFGELLARRFLRWWREAGMPATWRIIECGAHDGTLAADILNALHTLEPAALASLEYAIPEPLPTLQAAQQATLRQFAGNTRFLTNAADLAAEPLPGIAFGNEVLDALPFHVLEWQADGWHLCRVANMPDGGFCWDTSESLAAPGNPEHLTHPGSQDGIRAECPDHRGAGILPANILPPYKEPGHDRKALPDPGLLAALAPPGMVYPLGYRCEVRTGYGAFFKPLLAALSSGMLLWLDYGFARPEFHDPARTQGTLRTFSRHRAGDDPLLEPGTVDITAHVDFTAVTEVAFLLGCRPLLFRSQGSWLTEVAREWLLAMEGNPAPNLLRQFQTLTHPAHLGGRFHVLELAWNDPAAPGIPAADLHRLALNAADCSPPAHGELRG